MGRDAPLRITGLVRFKQTHDHSPSGMVRNNPEAASFSNRDACRRDGERPIQ